MGMNQKLFWSKCIFLSIHLFYIHNDFIYYDNSEILKAKPGISIRLLNFCTFGKGKFKWTYISPCININVTVTLLFVNTNLLGSTLYVPPEKLPHPSKQKFHILHHCLLENEAQHYTNVRYTTRYIKLENDTNLTKFPADQWELK